ncbi:e1ee10a0-c716-4a94-aa00-9aab9795f126-CDS [Sclerotinia trifoliorum]|uniref:E1ee10a0-c716-4a94-aa00-9aab9795f126-CDS n=1 Tax=Sclerotinia trifoliorum TaxID=28548 RepID=A0A8H2VWW3_9HELO|nr:e1ee10a0-c716-4a94-aa00-9aab9795f126-CDS [Sclerotinia trifoliorum]
MLNRESGMLCSHWILLDRLVFAWLTSIGGNVDISPLDLTINQEEGWKILIMKIGQPGKHNFVTSVSHEDVSGFIKAEHGNGKSSILLSLSNSLHERMPVMPESALSNSDKFYEYFCTESGNQTISFSKDGLEVYIDLTREFYLGMRRYSKTAWQINRFFSSDKMVNGHTFKYYEEQSR